MADLKAAARKKLNSSQFGLPATRQYPIHDKSHAANAKARASQQYKGGNLSKAQYNMVVRRANRVLKASGVKAPSGAGY